MYHIVTSDKPFDAAVSDLEAAVARNGFGVLHTLDLAETLRKKGVEFAEECKILSVCNPAQASKVLSADMRLNMALPCRISVYTEGGATRIGMLRPVMMLSALSDDPEIAQVAEQVEAKMMLMVEEAR